MKSMLDLMLQPPAFPIGMNPFKPFLDGKLFIDNIASHYYHVKCEHLYRILIIIFCYTVTNVSVAVSGDPRDFFVELVQSHLPEFQVQYGFGLKTDSKSIKHLHLSHFAYACKMRYPLNLVLEKSEYLWFY